VIVRWTTADWGAISCTGTQTTSGADTICTFDVADTGETFTPVALASGSPTSRRRVMHHSFEPMKLEEAPQLA
jgi:hypothetical protein